MISSPPSSPSTSASTTTSTSLSADATALIGVEGMIGEGAADDERVEELSNRALSDPLPLPFPFALVESCKGIVGVAIVVGVTGGGRREAAALLSAFALSGKEKKK